MNTTLTNTTVSQFSSYNALPTFINMAVHIVNCFVGLPLNCYMVKLLFTTGRVLEVSVVFDLSQAVAEIAFATATPFSILCYVNLNLCFLASFGFLYGSCMMCRSLFQCCNCVERYLAVVHPVTFLKYKIMRYRLMCAAVIWTFALLDGIVCLIYFPNLPHWVFGIVLLTVLTTDIFCCLSILNALWGPKPGDRPVDDVAMNTSKKRAFELVLLNLLTFLLQIIPFTVIAGLSPFIHESQFHTAVSISFICNIIPGCVQPLLFLRRVGKLTCTRHS